MHCILWADCMHFTDFSASPPLLREISILRSEDALYVRAARARACDGWRLALGRAAPGRRRTASGDGRSHAALRAPQDSHAAQRAPQGSLD